MKLKLLVDVWMILTLVCDDSSRLVSDSMDGRLSWNERLAVSVHRLICWSCRRLRRQLLFIRDVSHLHDQRLTSDEEVSGNSLSPVAHQRIKQAIEGAVKGKENIG